MKKQNQDIILESTEWLKDVDNYDPKAGGRHRVCHRCNTPSICWQHHIDRRRNGDRVVWICHTCHDWIHRNPKKAQEEGYYNKLSSSTMAEKKKKASCNHMTYYSNADDAWRCQFCGKLFKEPQVPKKKTKKS